MKLKTMQRCTLAAFLMASGGGGIATAASVTIPDFSFEISTNIPGGYVDGSGTNWLSTGNGSRRIQNFSTDMFVGTDTLPAPADGTNCLVEILNGVPGFCWQKVGNVQSNTLYTLTIAVGQSLIDAGGVGKIALVNSASPFGAVLSETSVDTSTVTPGEFADFTVTYTAGYEAAGDLTILMQGDSGTQLIFDNVRLDATALPLTPTAAVPLLSTPSGTIYRGTIVTLSERPAGAAPFEYRWQSDNGTGGATFTDIAGATGSTLAVDTTGFTVGNPVQYRVVVNNSQGSATSPVVVLTAIEGQPVITRETLPVSAYDVEGGEVTFTAVVDGSGPLALQWVFDDGTGAAYIPNATNASLTIKNLRLGDAGSYSLQASNEYGTMNSALSFLTVDPRPTDDNGVIVSKASQTGLGSTNTFSPTWTLATNSLIQGASPSESVGSFTLERAGGTPVLTDGKFGILPPAGNASVEVATCGRISSGAGSSIVYKLPAAVNGYDLTNIVIYGGWSDAGRDQQQYNVFYSTVAAPTNYDNMIAYVNFQPTNDLGAQCATRVSLTGTNGVVAKNVAAIKLDFNVLVADTENGYTGYAEFQAFGHPSPPAPVLALDTQPATGSDVVGSKMTFVAGFTSETPMTLQWRVDKGSGPVAIAGATNATLTLSNLQLSDSGSYSLKASNAAGSSVSKPSTFVVNPRPDPDGYGVIVSPANQTGAGATFTPTWVISTDSLIYGSLPSARGSSAGTFILENAGGIVVLTDGQFGLVGSTVNNSLATCGSGDGGKSVTYTLTGSQSGYDITNIVLYAGWSDGGRDQQAYTIYYSTVSDPNVFNPLSSTEYNPTLPGAVPSADRVSFTSSTSSPMAVNVAKIMIDFTSPAGENGYSGYAEISVLGSPSAAISIAPVVLTDTLPATGSDVVGSEVTFHAVFGGETPIAYQWRKDSGNGPEDIVGATSSSLTLSNLQLSDSGSYSLQASNAMGIVTSTPNTFTVKSAPTPENGMLIATANQTSAGETFSPTWILPSANLLAGTAPSSVGTGSFVTEGSGGTPVLTDGNLGTVGAGNASLASCGVSVGTAVTYTLAGSTSGYDLTRIVTYGGWGDNGRDQQHYTVSYSTVADPATFITLASASYNPDIPGSIPTADRVTITSATAAPLAMNVAAVRFDFTTPTGENNWSGYSELSVFGMASTPLEPPSFGSVTVSGGNLIMAGAGGTPGSGYTVLSSADAAAPMANWVTNSVGVFDASGAFSVSLPIVPTQPASFFRLRVP
jgi:hypothetical protein